LTILQKKLSWAIATLISGYRFFFAKNFPVRVIWLYKYLLVYIDCW